GRQQRRESAAAGQTVAKQLPDEHQRGGDGNGPQGAGRGAFDLQADADHAELEAEKGVGDQQQEHGAEDCGLEVPTHTFSTSGRPRIPVGRNSSTSTSRLKATTSLY